MSGADSRVDVPAWTGWRAIALAVVLATVAGGCRNRTVVLDKKSVTEEAESELNSCEKIVSNAAQLLGPDRLGVSTDRAQVAELLNQWRSKCGGELPKVIGPETKTRFSEAEAAELVEPRYVGRDVEHVRNCLLMRQIADHVVEPAERDIDRVNLLFDWVVRNIALSGASSDPLPLTPFEIVLFGRGSPEDRSWVFVELLRQLRIDAVILRPESHSVADASGAATGSAGDASRTEGSAQHGSTNDWILVGVLLEEAETPVYLYDPRMGTAIPANGELSLLPKPATLKQVLEDGALLEQMAPDGDTPAAITKDDLAKAVPLLATLPEFNRPAMKILQSQLPGDVSALIYDPLDDEEGIPGVVARVKKSGLGALRESAWAVWRAPLDNVKGFESLNEAGQQRLAARRLPFQAPLTLLSVEGNNLKFGRPRKQHLTTRITQMSGDLQSAVRSYQVVRTDGRFPLDAPIPPEIRQLHARAEEDAVFWTGICQYELGDALAAVQTLTDYTRLYPDSIWSDHARGLQARAYARLDKYAAAVQSLSEIAEDDPARDAHRWLQKRCRAIRESASEK